MNKKTIAVLFGGQSSEHEVSCSSAAMIIENINRDLYDIVLVGITKEGQWIEVCSVEDILSDGEKVRLRQLYPQMQLTNQSY